MRLDVVDVLAAPGPLPERVEEFLAEAERRIEDFHVRRGPSAWGVVPSDLRSVAAILQALIDRPLPLESFCEWGSGFGVICGVAGLLGCSAYGVEIRPELVAASRELLADFDVPATILEGSFIPGEYLEGDVPWPEETVTVLEAGAVDEVDVDIADFDAVFAFPWPGEEDLYEDLFSRRAARGALLITYHGPAEGVIVHRKAR